MFSSANRNWGTREGGWRAGLPNRHARKTGQPYHQDDATHGQPAAQAGGGLPLEADPAVGRELEGDPLHFAPGSTGARHPGAPLPPAPGSHDGPAGRLHFPRALPGPFPDCCPKSQSERARVPAVQWEEGGPQRGDPEASERGGRGEEELTGQGGAEAHFPATTRAQAGLPRTEEAPRSWSTPPTGVLVPPPDPTGTPWPPRSRAAARGTHL